MNDKPKVLYVDDEEINLMLFKLSLTKKYEVITAVNGVKGLEVLSEHDDIKIVVSDMKMPIMNGLEFIAKAKSIYPDLPYFILTGFDMNSEIEEAVNSGLIISYFKKPMENSIIMESFLKVLS